MRVLGTTIVIAAHGTQDPAGVAVSHQLADALRARLPAQRVLLAFMDVLGPTVREVLAAAPGPVTVVPAFLSCGYHVRTDVPREVAAAGRWDVTISTALGPHPLLVGAMKERLREAGWRETDAVVLAAAGSSDPRALADVRSAASTGSGSGSWPPGPPGSRRWWRACGRPGSAGLRWLRGYSRRDYSMAGSPPPGPMWWQHRWAHIPGSSTGWPSSPRPGRCCAVHKRGFSASSWGAGM
jgi:hypothetical protein